MKKESLQNKLNRIWEARKKRAQRVKHCFSKPTQPLGAGLKDYYALKDYKKTEHFDPSYYSRGI